MDKEVYLIKDITEFGKFVAFCIENDISVWRTYWDEREAGERCYLIDWKAKRCYYSERQYYIKDYKIIEPIFVLNEYGVYKMVDVTIKNGGQ